jgi:nicotinamidase-related amidase
MKWGAAGSEPPGFRLPIRWGGFVVHPSFRSSLPCSVLHAGSGPGRCWTLQGKAGIFIGYCISHFRPGFPEVSDRNKTRAARRDSGEVLPADPKALIHPSVLPQEGEPVIAKHRTSAFSGSAFEMILRAQNINTLIMMGHATSGVILSTVRLAADLDYQLIVVEDGCADRDPEVHKLLMEKVFPRQAMVVSSKEMVEALAAL